MSYTHQGSAHLVFSENPFGILTDDPVHEAVSVLLSDSATPGVACLELPGALQAPRRVRYVWMLLPSGVGFAGPVLQDERQPDGSGWLTFQVNENDMGWQA